MTRQRDNDGPAYASPPCFLHEVDPAYSSAPDVAHPGKHADVMRWRMAERERLISDRLAMSSDMRRDYGRRIAFHLEKALGDVMGLTISAYWPIRGEPDLLQFVERVVARGGRAALPVVIARGQPLIFRVWAKGQLVQRGVWNIPVPGEDAEVVAPDVVIAPVVGFDANCYRLGYGGGFFDRTLAAMTMKPRVFGVGYGQAAIATIYPQPHDIPMRVMVTEDGPLAPEVGADGTA